MQRDAGKELLPLTPHNIRHEFAVPLISSFSVQNACVIYYTAHSYGKANCHASQIISRTGMMGMVYGYSEHRYGYHRLTSVRPADKSEEKLFARRCKSRRLGLAAYFSSNNLFHQWFHAVPAFESFRNLAASSRDVTFLPLVGGNAGNWTMAAQEKSGGTRFAAHAWEFTLRALTDRNATKIASDLERIVGTGSCTSRATRDLPCVCFDHLEGSVGGFSPYSWGSPKRYVEFKRAALANARRWRAAAMDVLGQASVSALQKGASAPLPMMYVARQAKRSVTNERELRGALEASVPRLRFVILEAHPLAKQMWMIAESAALVGVHGQAFAWLPFLPFENRRTAAVEIVPYAQSMNKEFTFMYSKLGSVLGVNYTKVTARVVGECDAKRRVLRCNVTLDIDAVVRAVRDAARWTA